MKNISKVLVIGLIAVFMSVSTTLVNASTGTASISGTVYFDTTCNGLDLSDKPLANVTATLSSNVLGLPLKTKSDVQGNFHFSNLAYGFYALTIKADNTYQPLDYFLVYQLGEVNGAVSDISVFCKK